MSFNQIVLVGRLAKDPEVRTLNDGKRVASIRLITEERRSGKKYTEGHSITAYNEGLVKLFEEYVSKGDMILVTAQLRNTKWTDRDGVQRYGYELAMSGNDQLKFLSSSRSGEHQEEAAPPADEKKPSRGRRGQKSAPPAGDYDLNDDIPY